MAGWVKALMAILLALLILALLILFLPLGPIWFIPFLILFGIIIATVVPRPKKKEEEPRPPRENQAPAGILLGASDRDPEDPAEVHTARPSESSSSSSGFKYDLYLSFRDEDADEFVRLLHTQLKRLGLKVFSDSKGLRKGEEIGWELKEEIKQSKICIPILSRNFLSNKLCLDELVQMWECRESTGKTIFPIFCDIEPSDVVLQTGDFGTSFSPHEKEKVDAKFIEPWKEVFQWIERTKGLSVKDLNRNKDEDVAKVLDMMDLLKIEEKVLHKKIGQFVLPASMSMKRRAVARRMSKQTN